MVVNFCNDKIRYLLTGGLNTLAGYGVCLAVYALLGRHLHVVPIGLICNVLVISLNFLTYKLLVFRTRGDWLREYLRCYVVYGASSAIGIVGVWVLVDGLGMAFRMAVALTMSVAIVFSWFGHSRFTYKARNRPRPRPDGRPAGRPGARHLGPGEDAGGDAKGDIRGDINKGDIKGDIRGEAR
jgi:putative flippase GtrA